MKCNPLIGDRLNSVLSKIFLKNVSTLLTILHYALQIALNCVCHTPPRFVIVCQYIHNRPFAKLRHICRPIIHAPIRKRRIALFCQHISVFFALRDKCLLSETALFIACTSSGA